MKQINQRVYEPISNEIIAKVFADMTKNQEEYVDLVSIPTHDKLILVYREYDKTIPTDEDVQRYSTQPVSQGKGLDAVKDFVREYRILVIIGVVAVAAYFYLRGG